MPSNVEDVLPELRIALDPVECSEKLFGPSVDVLDHVFLFDRFCARYGCGTGDGVSGICAALRRRMSVQVEGEYPFAYERPRWEFVGELLATDDTT